MGRRQARNADQKLTASDDALGAEILSDTGNHSNGSNGLPAPANAARATACRPIDVRSVLIIDDQYPFVAALSRGFVESKIQTWSARSFRDAPAIMEICRPELVISELKVGGHLLFGFLPKLTRVVSIDRFVIVTSYPSIATAVRLIRMGVSAYLTKPVSSSAVLKALNAAAEPHEATPDLDEEISWPTLDRAIWEYLSQVHELAGSMSEAARRLGLDPRSLRRMLAKYPPVR
jgi:ActR/RegA family two-component response regulator